MPDGDGSDAPEDGDRSDAPPADADDGDAPDDGPAEDAAADADGSDEAGDLGEAEATTDADDGDDPDGAPAEDESTDADGSDGDDEDPFADFPDDPRDAAPVADRPDGRAERGETAEAPVGGDGPTADREMPLAAHIEEMLRRLLIVILVITGVSVLVFPFGEAIINHLWAASLPNVDSRPRLYSPLELVITQIKVASLAGIVVALPVLVYQSYRFMKPGLYPHERRYYLAAVPTSLILAFVGIVFGYFVMLPTIFTYFYSYSKGVAEIAFALGRTFDLILVLLGYLAVIFQIPLFIMLALMMGLVTRRWLADRRLIFWGVFLGISALFSPDPTGMAPVILTITMILLFEGTLQLAKWTKRGRERAGRA